MEARAVQQGETRAIMRTAYHVIAAEDAARMLKRPGLPASLREDLEQVLRADASRRG